MHTGYDDVTIHEVMSLDICIAIKYVSMHIIIMNYISVSHMCTQLCNSCSKTSIKTEIP